VSLSSYVTPGSLAEALRNATDRLRVVERRAEDMVAALFPGWRPPPSPRRGITFEAPDAIDVFDVVVSWPASEAMRWQGFRVVTLHDHRSDQRSNRKDEATDRASCRCRPRIGKTTMTSDTCLAADMRTATAAMRAAEVDVEELVRSLFPEWQARFPSDRSWSFRAPSAIEIYGSAGYPAAIDALLRSGFTDAAVHDHRSDESCGCHNQDG
jgi:hypothetical protein